MEYVGGGKLLFSVVEGKLVLLLFVSILNFVSLVEQPTNESEPRLPHKLWQDRIFDSQDSGLSL